MKKTVLFNMILFGVFVVGTPTAEASSATNRLVVTPEILGRLAEEMRAAHPALQAARARTNAAAAGVSAVRTWEDPTIRFGGVAAREEFRASDGDVIYGAEQKLPLFGKPRAARNVALAELGVEVANEDSQFQILRRELAKAAFRAALADQTVAIGEQDLAWLDVTAKSVENKYASGSGRLIDVLQLQNEHAKRTEQLQTDRQSRTHEQLALNRFLNRDLHASWPVLELPPVADGVVYNQALVNFALRYEPKLKALRAQIKQAQAGVELTRRRRLPDLSAGLESRNYSGNGNWRQAEFVLSLNLPWFNAGKYRSDIRRDEAKLKATEFDAADYEQSVREEVHMLALKIDAARREALLYRDQIIPRSEQALASAHGLLESSGGLMRDLLDARRMLLDARLMYARAVAEQYQMLSELVLCCGLGDLEALQMLATLPDKNSTENPHHEK